MNSEEELKRKGELTQLYLDHPAEFLRLYLESQGLPSADLDWLDGLGMNDLLDFSDIPTTRMFLHQPAEFYRQYRQAEGMVPVDLDWLNGLGIDRMMRHIIRIEKGEPVIRVIFKMIGGGFDGTYEGDGEEPTDIDEHANMWFRLTEGGKVGKKFKGIPPKGMEMLMAGESDELQKSGMRMHKYEIIDRQDDGTVVTVTAKFIPNDEK